METLQNGVLLILIGLVANVSLRRAFVGGANVTCHKCQEWDYARCNTMETCQGDYCVATKLSVSVSGGKVSRYLKGCVKGKLWKKNVYLQCVMGSEKSSFCYCDVNDYCSGSYAFDYALSDFGQQPEVYRCRCDKGSKGCHAPYDGQTGLGICDGYSCYIYKNRHHDNTKWYRGCTPITGTYGIDLTPGTIGMIIEPPLDGPKSSLPDFAGLAEEEDNTDGAGAQRRRLSKTEEFLNAEEYICRKDHCNTNWPNLSMAKAADSSANGTNHQQEPKTTGQKSSKNHHGSNNLKPGTEKSQIHGGGEGRDGSFKSGEYLEEEEEGDIITTRYHPIVVCPKHYSLKNNNPGSNHTGGKTTKIVGACRGHYCFNGTGAEYEDYRSIGGCYTFVKHWEVDSQKIEGCQEVKVGESAAYNCIFRPSETKGSFDFFNDVTGRSMVLMSVVLCILIAAVFIRYRMKGRKIIFPGSDFAMTSAPTIIKKGNSNHAFFN